jgi:hypothetical protein
MSIATLKRKTRATWRTASTGQAAFSINGTHRSQGYIGQTSLSQSLPRTLFRGDTARGAGGCCGTYNDSFSITSGILDMNDATAIKPSVVSSRGRIAKRYPWITGGSGAIEGVEREWVKPDSTHSQNTQGLYITYVAGTALAALENPACAVETNKFDQVCNFVAAPAVTGAVSAAEYIRSARARRRAPCGTDPYDALFIHTSQGAPVVCDGMV